MISHRLKIITFFLNQKKISMALSTLHRVHYIVVITGTIATEITSLTIVYSTAYSSAGQREHQSSASLAFVRGIHRDGEFPSQRASNAENVSIWWRHHVCSPLDVVMAGAMWLSSYNSLEFKTWQPPDAILMVLSSYNSLEFKTWQPPDVILMVLSSYNSLEFKTRQPPDAILMVFIIIWKPWIQHMTTSWCYLNGVTLDACTCLFCRQFLFWYHTATTKVKRLS